MACVPLPEGAFYEDLCFHAQQAVEKALKAVYQHNGWGFRYTHDLDELVAGLEREGLAIPLKVKESCILSSFAWESRYPGLGEPVTRDEYLQAVRFAELVVSWASQEISS